VAAKPKGREGTWRGSGPAGVHVSNGGGGVQLAQSVGERGPVADSGRARRGRAAVSRNRDRAQGVQLEREEVAPGPCFIDVGRAAWSGPKSTVTFSNYLK
jgi:hypothetical protein